MASDATLQYAEANGGYPLPELLVSSALHLMSHYIISCGEAGACVRLASVIERHLKALADSADVGPVLRAACRQLSELWAGMVTRAMRRPAASPRSDDTIPAQIHDEPAGLSLQ